MNNKDALSMYLEEVKKYPLLTKEETLELFEKSQNGDKEAREKLINCNLRLVIKNAKTYIASGLDLLDLIQQGNIGLIKAVDTWDPSRSAFSTFATVRITTTISRYCYENQKVLKTPQWQQELNTKIQKTIENCIDITGRKPSVEEIAEILDINPERIDRIYLDNSRQYISLDAKTHDDSNMKIEETIADESPSEFDNNKMRKAVMAGLKHLSPEERDILECYFGLNGKNKTLEQIGEELGVTKQSAQQQVKILIQKLRYPEILEEIRKEL